jgi:hypothetical protein
VWAGSPRGRREVLGVLGFEVRPGSRGQRGQRAAGRRVGRVSGTIDEQDLPTPALPTVYSSGGHPTTAWNVAWSRNSFS